MKYIIFDNKTPIIFSRGITHLSEGQRHHKVGNITSAGFISKDENGDIEAYGESVSLGIKSKKTDTDTIKNYIK